MRERHDRPVLPRKLKDYGADAGINYREEDIGEAVMQLTQGKGADIIIDMAGGKSLDALMAALRYRGRFCVVGASSGDVPSIQFMDVLKKGLNLHGVLFGLEMAGERAHALLHDLFLQVMRGELSMPVARIFSLKEAADAHRYAEKDHPFGRVIIKP